MDKASLIYMVIFVIHYSVKKTAKVDINKTIKTINTIDHYKIRSL